MHLYTVTDVNHANRLVAFCDEHGRHHAAHCTSTLPRPGEALRGSPPERGFTLLIAPDGSVRRMTFSQINGAQDRIFRLLHPAQAGRVAQPA